MGLILLRFSGIVNQLIINFKLLPNPPHALGRETRMNKSIYL